MIIQNRDLFPLVCALVSCVPNSTHLKYQSVPTVRSETQNIITKGKLSPTKDTISITEFQAKSEQVQDADDAIRRCFDYAQHNKVRVILFPRADYRISARDPGPGRAEFTFFVPGAVTIRCYGARFTSRNPFCFKFARSGTKWYGGIVTTGRMNIQASDILLKDVRVEYSWSHSFHLNGGVAKLNQSSVVKAQYHDIRISGCVSFRSRRMGYTVDREDYPFDKTHDSPKVGIFRSVNFNDCSAIEPSYINGKAHYSKYDFGFGVENAFAVDNISWKNCRAIKAPGCGWHFENNTAYHEVLLEDCYADSCGQDQSGYSYGFMFTSGMTFKNCRTRGNYVGNFVHENSFHGNDYRFINCKEVGFAAFSFDPVADSKHYIFSPQENGGLSCSSIYLGGSRNLPMFAVRKDIFALDSSYEGKFPEGKWIHYLYNTKAVFKESERPTSIASQPVCVTGGSSIQIAVTAKELSGTIGTVQLYVQQFDDQCKLISGNGKPYLCRIALRDVNSKRFQTFRIKFDAHLSLGKDTQTIKYILSDGCKWLRCAIVLTDNEQADKSFAISAFSVDVK